MNCKDCNVVLTRHNWFPSDRMNHLHRCKACKRVYLKKWKDEHRQEMTEYWTNRWKTQKPQLKEYHKKRYQKIRIETLTHYGGNPPKCVCCGETEIRFLCLDHINGGGNKERLALKGYTGPNFYYLLKNYNWPSGYQILCYNCNNAKGFYGVCPHERRI